MADGSNGGEAAYLPPQEALFVVVLVCSGEIAERLAGREAN
jgi:hypothetical protein